MHISCFGAYRLSDNTAQLLVLRHFPNKYVHTEDTPSSPFSYTHTNTPPHTDAYILTPHEAVVDKLLIDVEVRWSACAGLPPAKVVRDLGHLKAGLLQQAEDTGESPTIKRHLKVLPAGKHHIL